MRTETLCIAIAVERPSAFELPVGPPQKVRSAEADVAPATTIELTLVDCAGLCEE